MKTLNIYLLKDNPGRTFEQKARYVIASGYAAARHGGLDADPSRADRKKAAQFEVVRIVEQADSELKVTIRGTDTAIAEYRKILKEVV